MFAWDGWGLVPWEGPVGKLLHSDMETKADTVWVSAWALAGWKPLYHSEVCLFVQWDWALLILQVCVV